MSPKEKFVCSSLIYRVDGMDARLLYPIYQCRCKGALQNPKSSRNVLTNETFCKQRGDLPTDMQASRAAEANRIFILCATGKHGWIITASLRLDCSYLDFRQFYANWPKEITWCFPGDFEIIDRRQRLFRSTFYNYESRILSMIHIFKAFFSLLTVNSYYFLAAAWHLKSSWLPVTLR